MVVVAIISILAVIAIPAYNNYALKSKFAEVVLATGPTKTAISTCAVSGDCIVSNAISLGGATGTGSNLQISGTTANSVNDSQAAFFAYVVAAEVAAGNTVAQAVAIASNPSTTLGNSGHPITFSGGVAQSNSRTLFVMDSGGGNSCVKSVSNCGLSINGGPTISSAALSDVNTYMDPSINPYYATDFGASAPGGTAAANIPCVGASAPCTPGTKYAQSVSYDSTGVITATATASFGLQNETFVLTPSYLGGRVDWASSGTCQTRAAGALC